MLRLPPTTRKARADQRQQQQQQQQAAAAPAREPNLKTGEQGPAKRASESEREWLANHTLSHRQPSLSPIPIITTHRIVDSPSARRYIHQLSFQFRPLLLVSFSPAVASPQQQQRGSGIGSGIGTQQPALSSAHSALILSSARVAAVVAIAIADTTPPRLHLQRVRLVSPSEEPI
ncbi:uncharacterized protein PAN0_007d3344 [Moesziomyces antarcticus]|uniref:Uncharacterized protein n=1 Tax=Pseudozyma antarctica TaxID=84753 RepID=A0A081CEN1_PSEA2|nr:uncharacterized protein PAN0_007d3344 [Moesziomyces antarcticus]GAK65127.1 hypothetical protein PAN0_007d3344 [Moesziomyces antarcticus]